MRVLGISGGLDHDAAAALIVDGVVIAACEEERLSRKKRATREAPGRAVQYCLASARIDPEELDAIAFSWDPELAQHEPRLQHRLDEVLSLPVLSQLGKTEVVRVPHHRAHAAAAFFTSGYTESAVLVADGRGEDCSTSIWHGTGARLEHIHSWSIGQSLGHFYNWVTKYIGFLPGSAGKTMGLAALGKPSYDFPQVELSSDGYSMRFSSRHEGALGEGVVQACEAQFGPSGRRQIRHVQPWGLDVRISAHHADAAASAQDVLERAWLHLATLACGLTGSRNLSLGGGVALNCAANGKLRPAPPFDDIWIFGAAHDGGSALGAALEVAARHGEVTTARLPSLLLGPCYEVSSTVDAAVRTGLRVRDAGTANVAQLIEAGMVGGWFVGRSEYGPRALGGRSIVARADSVDIVDRINRIKGRENWRPIAPALSASEAKRHFDDLRGTAAMVEARWLSSQSTMSSIDGLIHQDGSIRPLVIGREEHPFYELLIDVGERIGSQAIANTSFNHESEPIVDSPTDALRTFVSMDLDFLFLDGVLVQKPGCDGA